VFSAVFETVPPSELAPPPATPTTNTQDTAGSQHTPRSGPPQRRSATTRQEDALGEVVRVNERAGNFLTELALRWKCDDPHCYYKGRGNCWRSGGHHYFVDVKPTADWSRAIADGKATLAAPPAEMILGFGGHHARRATESLKDYNNRIGSSGGGSSGGNTQASSSLPQNITFNVGGATPLGPPGPPAREPEIVSSPPTSETSADELVEEFWKWKISRHPKWADMLRTEQAKFADEMYNFEQIRLYEYDYKNLANDNPLSIKRGLMRTLRADVRKFFEERQSAHRSVNSDDFIQAS